MIRLSLSAQQQALAWRLCGAVGLALGLGWFAFATLHRFELSLGRLIVPLFGAIQALSCAAFGFEMLRRGAWSRPLNVASLIAAALALVAGKSAPAIAMAVYSSAIWLALRFARPRS